MPDVGQAPSGLLAPTALTHFSLGGCFDESCCTGGETEAQSNEVAFPKIKQPKTSGLPSNAEWV